MLRAFTISQNRYMKKIAIKMLKAAVPLMILYNWNIMKATMKISRTSRIEIGTNMIFFYTVINLLSAQ